VRVKAAALNHLDIWVRKGRPGYSVEEYQILGADMAGVVAAVGAGVEGIKEGDEVILNPGLSCGRCESCRRGEHGECLEFGIVGLSRQGAFAQFCVVPAENLLPKPPHLSFENGAALPLDHLTAWHMLFTRARCRVGETVLIHGIGGGVALAALQLAKLSTCTTIVTSSSDEKLARARHLGADHAINYHETTDVGRAVKDITGGRGVDIAIDSVGAAKLMGQVAALRKGGRAVHCGVTSGPTAEVNISALYWNQFTIMGSTMASQDDFRQLLAAVNAAKLTPVVDSVHALAEVKTAMARMEEGAQFGKIVLRLP
jgi:NADPH:quinone reductase-like Zn-dependent oxidoreductase